MTLKTHHIIETGMDHTERREIFKYYDGCSLVNIMKDMEDRGMRICSLDEVLNARATTTARRPEDHELWKSDFLTGSMVISRGTRCDKPLILIAHRDHYLNEAANMERKLLEGMSWGKVHYPSDLFECLLRRVLPKTDCTNTFWLEYGDLVGHAKNNIKESEYDGRINARFGFDEELAVTLFGSHEMAEAYSSRFREVLAKTFKHLNKELTRNIDLVIEYNKTNEPLCSPLVLRSGIAESLFVQTIPAGNKLYQPTVLAVPTEDKTTELPKYLF